MLPNSTVHRTHRSQSVNQGLVAPGEMERQVLTIGGSSSKGQPSSWLSSSINEPGGTSFNFHTENAKSFRHRKRSIRRCAPAVGALIRLPVSLRIPTAKGYQFLFVKSMCQSREHLWCSLIRFFG